MSHLYTGWRDFRFQGNSEEEDDDAIINSNNPNNSQTNISLMDEMNMDGNGDILARLNDLGISETNENEDKLNNTLSNFESLSLNENVDGTATTDDLLTGGPISAHSPQTSVPKEESTDGLLFNLQ